MTAITIHKAQSNYDELIPADELAGPELFCPEHCPPAEIICYF